MPCPLLYLRVENTMSEIRRVNEGMALFCEDHRLPQDAKFDILLSVEEVLSNIIRHGCPGVAQCEIILHATVSASEIQIRLEDNGPAFDPLAYPPPDLAQRLSERKCGGLGIHLVKRVMDSVQYERKNEKNLLIMAKTLREAGESVLQSCP